MNINLLVGRATKDNSNVTLAATGPHIMCNLFPQNATSPNYSIKIQSTITFPSELPWTSPEYATMHNKRDGHVNYNQEVK